MSTYIYAIHAEGTNRYKIGFTGQTPEHRIKVMQTGSPFKLVVLAFRPGTIKDEQKVHTALAKFRVQGEWFELANLAVLYDHFPALRPRPKRRRQPRIYNEDMIVEEILYQVMSYANGVRTSYYRKQWPLTEKPCEFWYVAAKGMGIENRKPRLTDEQKFRILAFRTRGNT